MSVRVKHKFSQLESSDDTIANGSLCGGRVFIRDVVLVADGRDGFSVWRLQNKVPEALLAKDPTTAVIRNATCMDYLHQAESRQLDFSLHSLFPEHHLEDDFTRVDLDTVFGNRSWMS